MLPTPFLGMFQSKMFCPSTCQFNSNRCQRLCFLDFEPLFQVWLLFQVPHAIIWQKYLSFSNAEFNSASIDTNLNKIEGTTRKLGHPFLFALLRFSANLIKFTFSVFPGPTRHMGKFFLDPGDGKKLAGTLKKKKKSRRYLNRNSFQSQNKKNVISLQLVIIIIQLVCWPQLVQLFAKMRECDRPFIYSSHCIDEVLLFNHLLMCLYLKALPSIIRTG